MFTGIVEEIGIVKSISSNTIFIQCSKVLEDVKIGDSIAVDGCCQTVISFNKDSFSANLSNETLSVVKEFREGLRVNLERALSLNSRVDGHIVQGHIDGRAKYIGNYKFEFPEELLRYVVYKGAICINGVSLTVSSIDKNIVGVAIIDYTNINTNLQYLKLGDLVNVETDILGRYVEKFLSTHNNSNITEDFLKENGF